MSLNFRVPREKIDDVRERTNIVEVVKRHVELKRAGTASWKGLCPFHIEKTPSFHVHESRQFFHCFGCSEKGDVFSFLTKIEQRTFIEVLRDLAEQAGVELPEKDLSAAERKAREEEQSEKDRMWRAIEAAVSFFQAQLAGPSGAAARAYLASRGISDATVSQFRLGYAPASWDALQRHLAGQGVAPSVAERLGLVGVNERGRYDFFRDRVMLPVLDRSKRPVGFSSRLLDPEAKERKYVNSPDSPLFHKKQQLYGLHAAMDAIRRSGQAILVEGNFDVLALHDAGIAEAVAPMGTALTVEQIAAVGRLSQRVIVIFDGDEAGQRAARKAVPLFVEADVDGRVGRLPRGVDPDELVRKEGAEVFRKLVATARPMVDQLIDDLCREARDEIVPEHVNVLEQVAPVLAALQNPAARNLYEGRLAQTLKIDLRQVRRAIDAARAGRRVSSPEAGVAAAPRAPRDVAKRVPPKEELWPLALLVTHSSVAKLPESRQVFDLLTDPAVRGLYRVALETFEGNGHLDVPAWLDGGAEDVREAVSETLMEGRFDNAEAAERTMKSLLVTLQKARIDAEISFLNKRLSELRGSGNVEEVRAIQLRAVELKRTKDQLRP